MVGRGLRRPLTTRHEPPIHLKLSSCMARAASRCVGRQGAELYASIFKLGHLASTYEAAGSAASALREVGCQVCLPSERLPKLALDATERELPLRDTALGGPCRKLTALAPVNMPYRVNIDID